MNRMHPQDLRAIMASAIHGGCSALVGEPGYQQMQCWNQPADSIAEADSLMAELERTAKPDLIAGCQRSHPHEDPCEHHDFKTEIARLNNLNARIEAERDHFRNEYLEATSNEAKLVSERDALKAELDALKEDHKVCGNIVSEIQRQERERIISLLDEDGHPALCVVNWDRLGEEYCTLFGDELRAALDPKPLAAVKGMK